MAGGRPTKYTKALLEKAYKYIDGDWEVEDHPVPSVAGLCIYLKINRDTAYDWAAHEDKKEFSDILRDLASIQEFELTKGGLNGQFNPTITKLMLTKHNYSDKSENTLQGPGGQSLSIGISFHDSEHED